VVLYLTITEIASGARDAQLPVAQSLLAKARQVGAMKLDEVFDRIVITNMPDRTDRRRRVTRQLRSVGVELQPGRVEIVPGVRVTDPCGFPSAGYRGCYLCALGILQAAWSAKVSRLLFIEDDLVFTPAMKTCGAAMVEELLTIPWHFAYLGHYVRVPPDARGWRRQEAPLDCGHFLAFNGTILERLVPFLEEVQHRPRGHPEGGRIAPDASYNHFRALNPDVITLVACPSLGTQGSSRSDLHPAWFDRVPLLRGLAHLARGALVQGRRLGFGPGLTRLGGR
jgi:hypothetical protein